MSRICYINQPKGLGDILICEPIMRWYRKLGYDITYWVSDEYMWIKDYIKDVNFIPLDSTYTGDIEPIYEQDKVYLPLYFKQISNPTEWNITGWLYDKYRVARLDPMMWKTFTFDRNTEKENSLFTELDLEGKDYILLNGASSSGGRTLNVQSDLQIVNMSTIEGYTMLDWCKVIENSKEFHTVVTSTIFPAIKLKHRNVTLYNRNQLNDGSFPPVVEIFKDFNFKYE